MNSRCGTMGSVASLEQHSGLRILHRHISSSGTHCVCGREGYVNSNDNFFFFLSFVILGPHPWHMEVPRLWAESELQLPAYATATATQNQASSVTYTTAHSNTATLDPQPTKQGQG